MKIKNILVVLCALCLGMTAVNAQVAFGGKGKAKEKTFNGKADGETKIKIKAVGELPKEDYNFTATVTDSEQAAYVSFTDAILNFGKIKKANLTASLTEQGQALLESEGELSIPFLINFSGEEDPGFDELSGTLNYLKDAPVVEIGKAAVILFEEEDAFRCAIGEVSNGTYSVLTDVRPSLTGTIRTELASLESIGPVPEVTNGEEAALTTEEIAAIAQAQIEDAVIALKLAKKGRKYSKLVFDEGSRARKFSLENVTSSVSDADANGEVLINFTGELPATLNYKKRIIKTVTDNGGVLASLLNGDTVSVDDIDLTASTNLKAGFRFKKAKGSIFQKNKSQKLTVIFSTTEDEVSSEEPEPEEE